MGRPALHSSVPDGPGVNEQTERTGARARVVRRDRPTEGRETTHARAMDDRKSA